MPKTLETLTRCAPGMRLERGQERMGQPDDGAEVDRHHPVELLEGHLVEPAAQRHPGVVHQQGDLRVRGRALSGDPGPANS
jgi:hypothetical protein